LESFRTGIRYNKEVEKAYIQILSKVNSKDEFKVVDVWVLIIIFSMENYRRDADLLLKKKIKEGVFTPEHLEKSITKFAEAFQQYFSSMNLLAGMWMRHSDERVREFGKSFYTLMYSSFKSDYIRQEILQALVLHIGSRAVSYFDFYVLTCTER
jgi:hypothetical protein